MLSTSEIDVIRRGCGELDEAGLTAFSLAAVHRVLPVYQVYGEMVRAARGHGPAHDALVAIARLLRGEGGLTSEKVRPVVDAALAGLGSDLSRIHGQSKFDLPEALAVEVVTAVTAALNGWKNASVDERLQAATGALEVDSVWSEGTAGETVSWERLTIQYQQQVRDLEELRSIDPTTAASTCRTIAYRSEREGMPYLDGMEELMKRLR
ncbi:hypothetical protein [Lentzea sp. NEAU-D7]|uniref:hypothetical protein n=1 Tax=Lentzea sp. NEAU-D7 TaxID=2994667 RepID=UPI00224AEEAA|nr:hypothetical protein [Lentzea sp. NEAU-D7]MCX2955425.1 hypothetical protein [Lentzea sp. NEAU-D7]